MMTVPEFLVVLEMGIVPCPRERNRPRDCNCPRYGDNSSCDDHSRGGERLINGDCPRDCEVLRILTILGMVTFLEHALNYVVTDR